MPWLDCRPSSAAGSLGGPTHHRLDRRRGERVARAQALGQSPEPRVGRRPDPRRDDTKDCGEPGRCVSERAAEASVRARRPVGLSGSRRSWGTNPSPLPVLAATADPGRRPRSCASTTSVTRMVHPCSTSTGRRTPGGRGTRTTGSTSGPGCGSSPSTGRVRAAARRTRVGRSDRSPTTRPRWPPTSGSSGGPCSVGRPGRSTRWPSRPVTRRWSRRSASSPGCRPVEAYAAPGILDGASDDRRTVVELAGEMAPDEVGALLAPLVAPWPCDLVART